METTPEPESVTEPQLQAKPKCPTCGGVLRYRWKTKDYVCTSGPHKFPGSQFLDLGK